MKLSDIRTDVFDRNGIVANLYTGDSHCKPMGKTVIGNITTYPAKHITGISLFLDPEERIIAAQMSTYTADEGIRCHLLDADLHEAEMR